jgi:hypothetical protein
LLLWVKTESFAHPYLQQLAGALSASVPSQAEDWDGLPPMYLQQLIDDNGGEAAFEGLATSNVKRGIIVPKTAATKLSLCAQLRREGGRNQAAPSANSVLPFRRLSARGSSLRLRTSTRYFTTC